jgi:DNA polymerase (family 10)
MEIQRKDVVATLERIAELLELKEENAFKVRAYQTAARAVKGLEQPLEEAVRAGTLTEAPGIGKGTASVIQELVQTGRSSLYEALRSEFPAGVVELLHIPGLGPKKVRQIVQELGVGSVGELEYACNENRLVSLAGFGQKTQDKVLQGIAFYKKSREWTLYCDAIDVAERQCEALRALQGMERAELAGELRRHCEAVRRIELVAAGQAGPLLDGFARLPGVLEVLELGSDSTRVRLDSGIECRLRVCAPERFGTALVEETGSAAHVEALGELPSRAEEEELYRELGLAWVPPALREGLGEVQAAREGRLPRLVTRQDLRGVLHNHTTDSDGAASLEAMVRQAEKRGFEYILITDHSKSAGYAGGLSEERLREQSAEIDRLQGKFPGIRILKGTEVDILPDGGLDYSDEVLAGLDLVIASVHSLFRQSKEEMTRRLVRALDNPHVDVLGHPTGRLLLSRKPYVFDMPSVIAAAARSGAALEINANPHRLDLDWRLLRHAREQGVRFCIDPDAHHLDGIEHVRFGVGIAQKGWLEPEDIWNTRGAEELLAGLARRGS